MSKRSKGLIHIYTGDGKGKTTASVGLAVRAAGQGLKVLFAQFFKEDKASSGEKDVLRSVANIELIRSNNRHPIFTRGKTDEAAVRESIKETYETVKRKVAEEKPGLLVLDEVMSAITGGWIGLEDLIDFIEKRPEGLEIVLTGRNAPVELVEIADYVTEMLKIKHPFDSHIAARKGIEF